MVNSLNVRTRYEVAALGTLFGCLRARNFSCIDEERIFLRHPGNLVAGLEPLGRVVRESIDVLAVASSLQGHRALQLQCRVVEDPVLRRPGR